jgi:N-methylhydantoinase A
MDVIQVAKEIKRGVDEQMAIGMTKELRVRGYLPEEFTMLAYGGNGPLHACGVADFAGIKKVLAPPFASVFSALGAGNMKQLHIHERGAHVVMYNATTRGLYDDYDGFNAVVEELEAKGREDLVRQGFDPEDVLYRLEMDMRYGNQLVTTAVVFDINRIQGVGDVLQMIKTFSDIYGKRYGEGSAAPEAGIRVQTIRVASSVDGDVVKFESLQHEANRTSPTPVSHREVHFVALDTAVNTPIYDAAALTDQHKIIGPAIVITENTTYLVEPGWRLEPTQQGAVWFLRD